MFSHTPHSKYLESPSYSLSSCHGVMILRVYLICCYDRTKYSYFE
jgi:hypothetical protein